MLKIETMTTEDLCNKGIEIIISGLVGKYINDLIDKAREVKSKEYSHVDYMSDLNYLKLRKIFPIAKLGQIPDFIIPNATMDKLLIDSFYTATIYVTKRLNIDSMRFNYYKSNLSAYNAENKEQLIGCMISEKDNPQCNDSRYYMGFRSIFFIMRENIEKMDVDFIDSVNQILKPFYDNYNNKAYLLDN